MSVFGQEEYGSDDNTKMTSFDSIEAKEREEKKDENGLSDLRSRPPSDGHAVYHPSSGSKISTIINQIEQVKDTVRENIDMVIDRGESLALLQEKSHTVNEQSASFRERSRQVEWRYCRELYKQRCIVIFIGIV